MASIGSFSGLASGIQWRDMIDQIMQLESARKLSPISNQIALQEKRRDAWSSFSTLLGKLSSAATGLSDGTAFGAFSVSTSSSSTKTLLSASASTSASPGSYGVEVKALAKQEKLSASAETSTTAELGYAGTFFVNGKAVTLAATDSLAGIRDKINAVNTGTSPSGVTASIVTVSDTEHYLTLTADSTGTRGVELIDSASSGGVLAVMGILDGAQPAVANSVAADAGDAYHTEYHQTQRFTSADSAVGQMLGLTSPPATASIVVDGVKVQVDLENDSLTDVLNNIHSALDASGKPQAEIDAAKAATRIVEEVVGGKTMYRLQTGAVSVNTDPADAESAASQRIVEMLGFTEGVRATELQAGQNSQIVIDGQFTVERRTNSVSDALAGITLDLKAAEIGTEVSVTVGRDQDAIVKKVEEFVTAFNALVDFQSAQRLGRGPLASNGSLRTMVSSLKNVLLSSVPGLDPASTAFTRTALAGVAFNKDGLLEVDTETLKSALTTNFEEVKRLFGQSAVATSGSVSFVSDTSATQAGTYNVKITQVAAVARSSQAFTAYTDSGTNANRMTITDAYTGKTGYISLANGDDLAATVAKLNNLFDAEGMTLSARADGGNLVIEGDKYGSAASFTVDFNRDGGASLASSIGFAAGTYAGADVQGKIYTDAEGEPATALVGSGQVLTGAAGTAAEGLSVSYTGSGVTPIAAGTIAYVRGIAGELEGLIDAYTRSGDGLIPLHQETLDDSISYLEDRELNVQGRLDRYEETLLRQFAAMESALSDTQAQGSWLAGQINSLAGFAPPRQQ